MNPKVFLLVALMAVLFISTPAFTQQEEITLSTYYPAPFGEYDELCAEKLLVDTPSAAELQDMARGDCHITRSLIVGQGGAPEGFSYNEIGGSLADGTVLIKGNVGIGTTGPSYPLDIQGSNTDSLVLRLTAMTNAPTGDVAHFRLNKAGAVGDMQNLVFIMPTTTGTLGSTAGIRAVTEAVDASNAKTGLAFITGEHSATSEKVRIANAGNVGIGTTNPTHKLSVVGTNLDTVAIGQIGGNARQLLIGYDTANNRGEIQALEQNVGWRNLTLNRYGGNVGIGTTSPNSSKGSDGYLDAKDVYLRDTGKWASEGGGGFGAWVDMTAAASGGLPQGPAATDGFVVAYGSAQPLATASIRGYTDANSNPTTRRCYVRTRESGSFTMPVRRGDYWKFSSSYAVGIQIYWIPLGT